MLCSSVVFLTLQNPSEPSKGKITFIRFQREPEVNTSMSEYKNMALCVSMKTVNILESESKEAIVSLYASFFTCRNIISHFLDLIQLWGETANKKYYEVPWILKSAWSSWLTIIHKVQILKWLSGIIPNQEISSLVLHSNEEKQCEVLLLYQFKWTWWWISLIMDCVL